MSAEEWRLDRLFPVTEQYLDACESLKVSSLESQRLYVDHAREMLVLLRCWPLEVLILLTFQSFLSSFGAKEGVLIKFIFHYKVLEEVLVALKVTTAFMRELVQ